MVCPGRTLSKLRFVKTKAADANLPWRRGRLVLLGQGRAGKSSTVRSLVGKPFDSCQASTVGVETASCEIQRGDAVDWLMQGPTSETESLVKQLLADGAADNPGKAEDPQTEVTQADPPAVKETALEETLSEKPQENLLSQLPVDEVAQKLDQETRPLSGFWGVTA